MSKIPKSFHVQHVIKSHKENFTAGWDGQKMHEIRRNDRGYKTGQIIRLVEIDPSKENRPTGRYMDVIILYIRYAPETGIDPFGLQAGFCVFDFLILNHFINGRVLSNPAGRAAGMSPPPFSTMDNPEE